MAILVVGNEVTKDLNYCFSLGRYFCKFPKMLKYIDLCLMQQLEAVLQILRPCRLQNIMFIVFVLILKCNVCCVRHWFHVQFPLIVNQCD